MVVVYVVLAAAVAAAVYFLFLRPSSTKAVELVEEQTPKGLPSKQVKGDGATAPQQPSGPKESGSQSASKRPDGADAGGQGSADTAEAEGLGASPLTVKSAGIVAGEAKSDPNLSLRPVPETSGEVQLRGSSAPPMVSHVRNIDGLRKGLEKTRGREGFFGRLLSVFAGKREIDPDIVSQIEEVLLTSDVGVKTTESLLARVREQLSRGELANSDAVWDSLRNETLKILQLEGGVPALSLRNKPTVILMVGVNGAGKTTTIGKLATRMKSDGHQVILAAADTFRAAAVQQLVVWGSRVGVEVVKGKDGADPGSVIFEAIQRAKQSGADVVLADTAGRLHTKANLMAELTKVVKTTGKALDGAPHETLLVVDATNGQNALAQATEFQQALPLTGVVLTKLDGTAKGGVVLGICDTLKLPVRFVGLGETANDLHDFEPAEFVEALLGQDEGQV